MRKIRVLFCTIFKKTLQNNMVGIWFCFNAKKTGFRGKFLICVQNHRKLHSYLHLKNAHKQVKPGGLCNRETNKLLRMVILINCLSSVWKKSFKKYNLLIFQGTLLFLYPFQMNWYAAAGPIKLGRTIKCIYYSHKLFHRHRR